MRAKGSLARAGTLVHDTVTRDATLRDALEAVLTDNAGRVAVTGRRGAYEGVVDMETLMNSVQELLEADRLDALEHAARAWRSTRAAQTHAEQEGARPLGRGAWEVRRAAGRRPEGAARGRGLATRGARATATSRTARGPRSPVPAGRGARPGRLAEADAACRWC
ncbi:hypothetical protein STENM223S_05743 [Streptomyces tendae]